MKLNEGMQEVSRFGVSQETQFSIKASAKAFRILSSQLYSDKPRAIVRELSTNAYDAHVAAGHPGKPFDVQLPSRFTPEFVIRDYGTGLSDEGMTRVYTTYFESTKTDSNDYVGALGLGSKSPFSYVEQFTITSYYNGEKSTYSAFLNEQGVPSLALFGKEATKEPNGVEIRVPVKKDDVMEFERAALKVYPYFPTTPKISGADIKIQKPVYSVRGDCWGLTNTGDGYYGRGGASHAIQGTVSYPLDGNVLGQLENKYKTILNMGIDIYFEIGELDVNPGREALSYDKDTIENIKKKLELVIKHFQPELQSKIDVAKTEWEARYIYNSLTNDRTNGYYIQELLRMKALKLTYKGVELTGEYFSIKKSDYVITTKVSQLHAVSGKMVDVEQIVTDFEVFTFREYSDNYRMNKMDTSYQGSFQFQADPKTVFVYDDVGRGVQPRVTKYLEDNRLGRNNLFLVRSDAKKFKEFIKELGSPKYILASTLDVPVKAPRAPGDSVNNYVYDHKKYSDRTNGWNKNGIVDVDTVKGVYVIVDRFSTKHKDGNEWHGFNDLVRDAVKLGWVKENEILGFTPRYLDRAKANKNLVHFADLIAEKIKIQLQDPAYTDEVADHTAIANTNYACFFGVYRSADSTAAFVKNLEDGDFKNDIIAAQKAFSTKAPDWLDTIKRLAQKTGVELKAGRNFEALWSDYVAKFPMIGFIDRYATGNSAHMKTIAEYINMMQKNG